APRLNRCHAVVTLCKGATGHPFLRTATASHQSDGCLPASFSGSQAHFQVSGFILGPIKRAEPSRSPTRQPSSVNPCGEPSSYFFRSTPICGNGGVVPGLPR